MAEGRFIAVGTGIQGVGQMTLEAAAWIRSADIVCYCVSDPATVVWIKENARRERDLYDLYGNAKRRIDTYNEMVEVMCGYVREGLTVAGVFYGHPGLFCYPAHTAISILRGEGYEARMLAGVSAADCLFADAGFDPAAGGIQMVEATDLVLRRRPLLTDSHVIVWQIGSIGDLGFNYGGYDNRNLGALIAYLEGFYPSETKVLHYAAALFPVSESKLSWVNLADLAGDRVTGISTLYIPPLAKRAVDNEAALELGIFVERIEPETAQRKLTIAPVQVNSRGDTAQYQPIPVPNPVASFINRVALDPMLLTAFRTDAEAMFDDSLSPRDRRAIASGDVGAIRMAIKQSRTETAQGDPVETAIEATEMTEVADIVNDITEVVEVVPDEEGPRTPTPQPLADSDPIETVVEVTEVEATEVTDTPVVVVVEEGAPPEPQRLGDADPVETVTEVTEVEVTDVVAETDVVDVIEMIVEVEVPEGGDGGSTKKT